MPKFLEVTDKAAARAALETNGELVVEFAALGQCDGVTNDREALSSALSALSTAGGGTLVLPPTDIAVTLNALPTFDVPANTKIVGAPGATRLLLTSSNNSTYVAVFGSSGDNVAFEGLTLVRSSDSTMIFFYPGATDGFHLRDCVIDGNKSTYSSNIVHGMSTERAGSKSNITMTGCTVTGVGYGYLQSNVATGTVDTFTVQNCLFDGNYSDDLEFNSPAGTMSNVSVSNSRFVNPQGTSITASLGVGLAHVTNAVVRDNYFEGYYSDAIHLEDYCTNVVVAGNRIVNCATVPNPSTSTEKDRAGITVMTGCSDVVICGNVLDHTANDNGLHGIVIKNLGGAETPGGRPNIPPLRVTISDNIILCGSDFQGMWITDLTDGVIRGNTIIGAGAVASDAFDGANDGYGMKISGGSCVIDANTVTGFRYGIGGPFIDLHNDDLGSWNPKKALANVGSVASNLISDCYIGLVAVPAGKLNIVGNTLSDCVRPMVVGENDYVAQPCSVTANFTTGCTYPLEVGGVLVVERAAGGSTVTVGSAKTIEVTDVMRKLPVGTMIKFSGGGILTLTTAVAKSELIIEAESPYDLVGNVSGADIGADEYGMTLKLAHSTTAANDQIRTEANADSPGGYLLAVPDPNALSVGESSMPRTEVTGTNYVASNGAIFLTYFTARRTETISSVTTLTGSQAQVGATHCRIGVYEQNTDGSLTLVAYTNNDTNLWLATSTEYSTSFVDSFVKIAGRRYAVGLLVVGSSTAPYFFGQSVPQSTSDPVLGNYYATAGTINASVPASSLVASGKRLYAVLKP